jgi:hypothetical protein
MWEIEILGRISKRATGVPNIIKVANYKIIAVFIASEFIFNIKAGCCTSQKTIQHHRDFNKFITSADLNLLR